MKIHVSKYCNYDPSNINSVAAERLVIEFSTFNDISIGMSLQKSSDLDCEKSPDSVACKFKIEHFPSIIVIKHDGSDPVIVGGDTLEGQWGVHDGDQLMRNLGSELRLKTSHNWDQQSHIGGMTFFIKLSSKKMF